MSLRVLLDSLPRRRPIVTVFAVCGSEVGKDKDGKTRDELHDGHSQTTTVALASGGNQ